MAANRYFNPRIPYGMRPQPIKSHFVSGVFQSTHPVWDATLQPTDYAACGHISIHASRMGCDQTIDDYGAFVEISIHASRMGCDRSVDGTGIAVPDFNPRIPYGMRLKIADKSFTVTEFQSTHPVWDATRDLGRLIRRYANFNPRIPYGMRQVTLDWACGTDEFQSTHPVWDATAGAVAITPRWIISIHASRMGCDGFQGRDQPSRGISIHASRMGCDGGLCGIP